MLLHHYMIELTSRKSFTMDITHYWSFAHKYSIWNASVAALQFGTADLNPQTLSSTIERVERVYTAFFYSDSAQHLCHVEEEVLFSHFMTTLNDAFEWELASEDIEYKSGSALRTMTISCFHTRKFIFWTCHSKSTPISH